MSSYLCSTTLVLVEMTLTSLWEALNSWGNWGVGCSDEQSDAIFPLPTTGDIVWLRSGDRVPCEMRLIEAV